MASRKPALVLVKWHDARLYSGTRKKDAVRECKMALFESVGYLVSRDDTTTIIAGEQNDEEEYRDITLIPTGSIVSVRRLSTGPVL